MTVIDNDAIAIEGLAHVFGVPVELVREKLGNIRLQESRIIVAPEMVEALERIVRRDDQRRKRGRAKRP